MDWMIPFVTLLGILGTGDVALTDETNPWRTDFTQAVAEAQRIGRPLLLHFSAEWCGPCQRMQREVLNAPVVLRQIGQRFVAVRIDSDAHPELVKRFAIHALPSDLFVAPDGRVLARQEGYQNRDVYVARLARIDAQFTRMQKLLVAADSPTERRQTPDTAATPAGRKAPAHEDAVPPDGQGQPNEVPRPQTPGGSLRSTPTTPPGPNGAQSDSRALKPYDSYRNAGPPPSFRLHQESTGERPGAKVQEPESRAGTNPSTAHSAPSERPVDGLRIEPADRTLGRPQPVEPNVAESKPTVPQASPHPGAMGGLSTHQPGTGAEDADTVHAESKPALGLAGYSPVSLWRDRKWKKGDEEFAGVYKGIFYYMASADELDAFRTDPARYAPRLLGADPVILWETDRAVPGSVRFAAYFDDDLYLFANAKSRQQFKDDPLRYTRTRHVLKDRSTSRN